MSTAFSVTSALSSIKASVISKPPRLVNSGTLGCLNKSYRYIIEPLVNVIVLS